MYKLHYGGCYGLFIPLIPLSIDKTLCEISENVLVTSYMKKGTYIVCARTNPTHHQEWNQYAK